MKSGGVMSIPTRRGSEPVKGKGDANLRLLKLYDELRVTLTARKRKGFANLKLALDGMVRVGAATFSYAAAARMVAELKLNGPSYQTVLNADGSIYRLLIDAYAKEFGKVSRDHDDPEESLVAAIGDRTVAAQVKAILADKRSLQYRINILKAEIERGQPRLENAAIAVEAGQNGRDLRPSFTPSEIAAVRKFCERVEDCEWVFDNETGALQHERTRLEVAPPGFRQALIKILDNVK